MKKYIIMTLVLLSGCTDADKAYQVLSDNGYSQIKIGDYAPFMCGQDDMYHTQFSAVAPGGHYVEGVVCAGIMKGATIRF
jgi:hypothetical protein